MPNDRLRHAITQAGLEPEQLAELVEVDIKTVERWLAGRVPHPRLRRRVARTLEREEHDLWPDVTPLPEPDADTSQEIHGSWAHADDPAAPDWQELLQGADAEIELLDHSLLDLLATNGTTETLAAKAAAGCRVRILICAPDSIWVAARARALGQREEDHISRSPLELEIETARGYLEALAELHSVELCQIYADPGYRILRFDHDMLISPHLAGIPITHAPLLHLRRHHHDGLFDQFATHLDTLTRSDSRPIKPAPELYPDPRTHPARYKPLTAADFEHLGELTRRDRAAALTGGRALEEIRAELRRPTQPAGPPPTP